MNSRIIHIFVFIAALLIFFLYVNPTWNGSIAATKSQIQSTDQTLKAAQDYAAKQNELLSQENSIDPANLTALKTFLPDSVDNVGLILDLNALAARTGLSVSNIDVVTNEPNSSNSTPSSGSTSNLGQGALGSVDLSLSAVGPFSALQSFLKGIETSLRLLDVDGLLIRGSDTGVYSYQMTLHLYWLH